MSKGQEGQGGLWQGWSLGIPGWAAGAIDGESADHLGWGPWNLKAVQNSGQMQGSWPQGQGQEIAWTIVGIPGEFAGRKITEEEGIMEHGKIQESG